MSSGSLFPSLHRMEGKGWVETEWFASENNRRAKYYRLTASGRTQLKVEERDWNQVVKIMTAAVESACSRKGMHHGNANLDFYPKPLPRGALVFPGALTEEKRKEGHSELEAQRLALLEFGGVEQVKEEVSVARAGRFRRIS